VGRSHGERVGAGRGSRRETEGRPVQEVLGVVEMFSPFRMIWVNPIEQRKYQTIHA
jgi:hypothetical protein